MRDLPRELQPRRITTDPHNGHTRWIIRCVIPGCPTGFYAEADDQPTVVNHARSHLRGEHGWHS